jgi:tetratricopeptide (TPR) repeat protein
VTARGLGLGRLLTLVGLVSVSVYIYAVEYDFVWDDVALIAENAYIRSPRLVGQYFRRDFGTLSHGSLSVRWYYRPLLALSFFTDYQAWGTNPAGFHLTNILLHLLSSLLVALLARRLSGRESAGALAGLFFAVHPAHVEPVAFISGRVDSLVTAFGVAAVLALLTARGKRGPIRLVWQGFGCLGAAAAMLSKEIGALVPGLAFLCLAWDARRSGAPWRRAILSGLRESAGAFAVLALYLGGRQVFFPVPVSWREWSGGPGLWRRLATGMYLGGRAFGLVTVGFPWQPLYQMEFLRGPDVQSLAGALLLAGAAAAIWWGLARGSLAALGGLWLLAAMLPVLNVIPMPGGRYVYFAERFMYLPSVGAALAAGSLGAAVLRAVEGRRRRLAMGAMAAGLIALGVTTTLRSETWRDNGRLFLVMRDRSPRSTLPVTNLALTTLQQGRPEEALALVDQVFKQNPTDETALVVMGQANLALGRTDEGLAYLRKAVEYSPTNPWLLNILGAGLNQANRSREAIPYLQRALTVDPLFPPALMNLGLARAREAEFDEAVRLFRKVQALRPDWPEPRIRIGQILLDRGRPAEALDEFQAALRAAPDHPAAMWAVASSLDRLGRRVEARIAWERLRDLPGAESYRQMAIERLR